MTYAIANDVKSVVEPEGAVILDIPNNQILHLNSTGSFVWKQLSEGNSPVDIVRALAAETSMSPLQIEEEVLTFLRQLETEKLIVRSN